MCETAGFKIIYAYEYKSNTYKRNTHINKKIAKPRPDERDTTPGSAAAGGLTGFRNNVEHTQIQETHKTAMPRPDERDTTPGSAAAGGLTGFGKNNAQKL